MNKPTTLRLSNGLTIVAESVPSTAVSCHVVLPIGSAIETDAINGMAHFLEHMIFKGTPSLAVGEFEQRLESVGAIANAATSQDYTQYYFTCAPQDFAQLAPLQLEILSQASIPEEAFELEKLVILEEIRRSEDNLQRRAYQWMVDLACAHQPYRRPILGPESVIANLQAQQMRDFHGNWYSPDLMTIAVVGNLPIDQLIEPVIKTLDGFSPSNHPRLPTLQPEPPFPGITQHEHRDPRLQQTRLMLVWRVPGLNQLEQTYALDMLAVILGQGKTSRLWQDLREKRRLVQYISVSNITYLWQGLFLIGMYVEAAQISQVVEIIQQHIADLHNQPVTALEMERVKRLAINRFIFGGEKPSDRASLYSYHQSLFGSLTPALEYPQTIQKLHSLDLQLAARQYLAINRHGIITAQPAAT